MDNENSTPSEQGHQAAVKTWMFSFTVYVYINRTHETSTSDEMWHFIVLIPG